MCVGATVVEHPSSTATTDISVEAIPSLITASLLFSQRVSHVCVGATVVEHPSSTATTDISVEAVPGNQRTK